MKSQAKIIEFIEHVILLAVQVAYLVLEVAGRGLAPRIRSDVGPFVGVVVVRDPPFEAGPAGRRRDVRRRMARIS